MVDVDILDAPRPLARPHLPYPGLRPFDEGDAVNFYGREAEVGEVLALLERQQLVVIHGSSGCGKSSVVRAGVIPTFRLDGHAGGVTPHVVVIRPSDHGGPLAALARALDRSFPIRQGDPSAIGEDWADLLVASPDWKGDIQAAVRAAGATLCFVIDQFEEVFALRRIGRGAETERLIDFLISLDEPAPEGTALGERPLSVILTMRSDYLGHCALWDGFAETINRAQYLLPKMSRVGLLRAIHQPALRYGGSVEATVANHLIPVMATNLDGLPILQHALMRAWQVAEAEVGAGRAVTLQHLDQIGGVAHALSWHAEEAFQRATGGEDERVEIADWMFRALSDLDTDLRIIRRSVTFEQLVAETGAAPEMLHEIVDVFRSCDFSFICPLGSEPIGEHDIISVTHEALLRRWGRISDRSFQGQFKGLVFREFLDGMLWRSLSVQAEEFAKDQTSVLSAATTEQRLPWFREIARRPGWAGRYPVRSGPDDNASPQERWDKVAALMKASEVNLERERGLILQLRRTRRLLIALLALLTVAAAVVTFNAMSDYMAERQAREAAAARAQKAESDAAVAVSQRNGLLEAQTQFVFQMAERQCLGKQLAPNELQQCVLDEAKRLLSDVQQKCQTEDPARFQSCLSEMDLNEEKGVPMSPYGGVLGQPAAAQPPAGEKR